MVLDVQHVGTLATISLKPSLELLCFPSDRLLLFEHIILATLLLHVEHLAALATISVKPSLELLCFPSELLLLVEDALGLLFLLDAPLLGFSFLLISLASVKSIFLVTTHAEIVITLDLDFLLAIVIISKNVLLGFGSDNVCIKLDSIGDFRSMLNSKAHVSFYFLFGTGVL